MDTKNYGESKIECFESLLEQPNRIPSHETIGREFCLINPLESQKAFYVWTRRIVDLEYVLITLDASKRVQKLQIGL